MPIYIPPQDVPLVDPKTGLISPDWYDKLKLLEPILNTPTFKIVQYNRVMSLANGSVSVTGLGYKPRAIQFQTSISGGSPVFGSVGMADGVLQSCTEFGTTGVYAQISVAGVQRDSTLPLSNYMVMSLTSFDIDGFTVAFTKSGSPTLTATINALCFR